MISHYDDKFDFPIGGERIMLMPPFNVVMAARLNGTLDTNAVKSAAERLRTRHALLAVRVQFDSKDEARFRTDGVPAISVREVHVEDEPATIERHWLREVMQECQTSFPLERGPLVRFVVLHGRGITYLLVTGHHAICDGKSLTFLVRDVLRALSNPDEEPERLPPPPPIDETTVPNPPKTPWIARFILNRMSRKWRKKGIHFNESDRRRLHRTFWEQQNGPVALAWALTSEQTASLIAACRAEGVTVNSALWTAFLLAQLELQGNESPYLSQSGMAVSTRDRLNTHVGESLGFYVSSLSVKLPVDSKTTFWDVARKVQMRIRKALDKTNLFRMLVARALPPTLLDSLYFAKYKLLDSPMSARMLKQMRWDRISYGYSITNVGRSNIPTHYGPHILESLYGPFFYSDVNEKVVGVSTVGDVLTFSLTCNESSMGSEMASQLKEASLAHLKRAMASARKAEKTTLAPAATAAAKGVKG